MKRIVQLFLYIVVPAGVWAQYDSTAIANGDTASSRKNIFTASINYQTRLHYLGRTDSLQTSGFIPIIEYQLKAGVYANASFIFLQNKGPVTGYTGTVLEAGYRFPETKHFAGSVSVNRLLYKDNSALVQSAIKWQSGAKFTWKNAIVNITGGASARLSDEPDIVATGVADHLFIIKIPHKQSFPLALAINPTVTVNAGTHKFSETYSSRKTFLGIPVGQSETVNREASAFELLDYEFSMPVVIVAGKFFTAVTPAYVLPQHLVTAGANTAFLERGNNMFYITATMGVRL